MNKVKLSKNETMLILTSAVVLLTITVHIIHRVFGFLEDYLVLQGIVSVLGFLGTLTWLSLIVPIGLLMAAFVFYKREKEHPLLPLLITLALTSASISLIAGGNGLVEYHFSIFMVIAIISSFQSIRMILVSTVLFAIHHLGGYFLFPEILCGTSNYSFSLLMIHAVFLLLTSSATILIISNNRDIQQHSSLIKRSKRHHYSKTLHEQIS